MNNSYDLTPGLTAFHFLLVIGEAPVPYFRGTRTYVAEQQAFETRRAQRDMHELEVQREQEHERAIQSGEAAFVILRAYGVLAKFLTEQILGEAGIPGELTEFVYSKMFDKD